MENGANSVVVGTTGVRYAQIHNAGGVTHPLVTKKMRNFFFAQYKKTGDKRALNIATTKKSNFTVNIPKRQFMGKSKVLHGKLIRKFVKELSIISKGSAT